MHKPAPGLSILAYGALYFAAAWLGQAVTVPGIPFPAFWLGGGLQVVGYLALGARRRLALLGAFVAADLSFSATAGLPMAREAVYLVAGLGEGLLAAVILAAWLGERPRITRVQHLGKLVVTAAVSSLASGILTAGALAVQDGAPFGRTLLVWWAPDLLGMVMVVGGALGGAGPPDRTRRGYWLEALALAALGVASSWPVVFAHAVTAPSLQFLLVPGLVWGALRFGMRGVSAFCAGVTVLALVGLSLGTGEFAEPGLSPVVLTAYLQLFAATLLVSHQVLALVKGQRAEALAQARTAEERLRDADRRKDEFLAVLSHELRNPLAPIRTAVHILARTPPADETGRRALAVVQRQVEHVTRLVGDLLDVSRIARGVIEIRRARTDLRDLVRRATEDHRASLEEAGVALRVELPDEPCWVEVDAARITQVVGNLLHNAGKFTPPGGRVTVSVVPGAGWVEVHVRDTGVGIEPEVLRHLFEPFVQAERTLARTTGGLGLGLVLVKRLAELHGGAVRAESAGRGRGAELIVRLPRASATSAEQPAPPAAAPTRCARVLVVEDNVDAAELLANLVQLFGHDADVAHDGPTALAKARARRPDVVLCDIGLPGMSGYDVARAMKRDPALRGTRLVAVTGYAQPDDRNAALAAGFERHIAKPADPAEIDRVIAGA